MADNSKYSKAFRPYSRKDVTLAIEPHAAFNDEQNPLSAAHEKFSRFSFALLKDGRAHTMNMRWFSDDATAANEPNNYLAFVEMFESVKGDHLTALNKNSQESVLEDALDALWAKFVQRFGKGQDLPTKKVDSSSPAFTLVFKNGKFTKGKTAVQVLKEDEDGKNHLLQQKKWLEDNLQAYPDNANFIKAIDDALLLDASSINNAKESVKYVLYTSGYRLLASKTNKHDKKFTYKGEINFYPGLEYPTEIIIENSYCDTKKKGELEYPELKTAEEKSVATISLTWNETLRMMKEFELYFNLKTNKLYAKGISVSEEIGYGSDDSNNNSTKEKPKKNEGKEEANKSKSANKTSQSTSSKPTSDKEQKSANTEPTSANKNATEQQSENKSEKEVSEQTSEENVENTSTGDMQSAVFYNVDKISPFKDIYCTKMALVPIEDVTDDTKIFNCCFDRDNIEKIGYDNFSAMVKTCNESFETNVSWQFPTNYIIKKKNNGTEIMHVRSFNSDL